MPIRIVVGGIPNCGKSSLTASVYREMQARGLNVGVHELDVFQNTLPCILGVESWEHRPMVKSGDWTDSRINQAIDAFMKDESQFVLGDLTGIIDSLVEKMIEGADSAIIVGRDQQGFQKWLDFFDSQKIPVMMKIISFPDNLVIPNATIENFIFVRNLQRKVLQNDEIRKVVSILLSYHNRAG